jgi:hypothetical protein
MKTEELEKIIHQSPFRPFTLRVNSGATYKIESPRNVGAPEDCRIIFYFGKGDWAIIDPESITEIIGPK